jgi:hypothetical protein
MFQEPLLILKLLPYGHGKVPGTFSHKKTPANTGTKRFQEPLLIRKLLPIRALKGSRNLFS